MSAKYAYDGNTVKVNGGTAGIASGDVVVVGELVGVAPYPIAASADGVITVTGIFECDKGSDNITAGVQVYWDASNKVVTTTSTNNTLMGRAVEAAGSTISKILVRLD